MAIVQARVTTDESPPEVGGGCDHHERDGDLAAAAEERRFDEVGYAQIDVLLVARERVVERERKGEREHDVRRQLPSARHGERQRQRENREEIALVRARREEVEGETGDDPAGEKHRRVATPPQRNDREDETRDEQDAAPDTELVVWGGVLLVAGR